MANLETLQSLAKLRGGHLISKKYSGYTAYYKWKCNEGHTWLATPTGIGTKRWCPKCGAKQRAKAKTCYCKGEVCMPTEKKEGKNHVPLYLIPANTSQ
jgi:hypothetical protein